MELASASWRIHRLLQVLPMLVSYVNYLFFNGRMEPVCRQAGWRINLIVCVIIYLSCSFYFSSQK